MRARLILLSLAMVAGCAQLLGLDGGTVEQTGGAGGADGGHFGGEGGTGNEGGGGSPGVGGSGGTLACGTLSTIQDDFDGALHPRWQVFPMGVAATNDGVLELVTDKDASDINVRTVNAHIAENSVLDVLFKTITLSATAQLRFALESLDGTDRLVISIQNDELTTVGTAGFPSTTNDFAGQLRWRVQTLGNEGTLTISDPDGGTMLVRTFDATTVFPRGYARLIVGLSENVGAGGADPAGSTVELDSVNVELVENPGWCSIRDLQPPFDAGVWGALMSVDPCATSALIDHLLIAAPMGAGFCSMGSSSAYDMSSDWFTFRLVDADLGDDGRILIDLYQGQELLRLEVDETSVVATGLTSGAGSLMLAQDPLVSVRGDGTNFILRTGSSCDDLVEESQSTFPFPLDAARISVAATGPQTGVASFQFHVEDCQ